MHLRIQLLQSCHGTKGTPMCLPPYGESQGLGMPRQGLGFSCTSCQLLCDPGQGTSWNLFPHLKTVGPNQCQSLRVNGMTWAGVLCKLKRLSRDWVSSRGAGSKAALSFKPATVKCSCGAQPSFSVRTGTKDATPTCLLSCAFRLFFTSFHPATHHPISPLVF